MCIVVKVQTLVHHAGLASSLKDYAEVRYLSMYDSPPANTAVYKALSKLPPEYADISSNLDTPSRVRGYMQRRQRSWAQQSMSFCNSGWAMQ
jgi:hypothetical protein